MKTSYSHILKTSSIMGGAAGINLFLGLVRIKFTAVLIGTNGMGLLANYTAIQGVIGSLAGLGIQSSAVREIAAASGKEDHQAIGQAVLTLRRICWFTGLLGMVAMMLLSPIISKITFGSDNYSYDIAILGVVILLTNLAGGQLALLQGMRRIGDVARANLFGAAIATAVAIGFYTWLGLRGIVPALISIAAINYALSWQFARSIPVPQIKLTWWQTYKEAGKMVKLGLVFMWTSLITTAVAYITNTLITQELGVTYLGIYSAAYSLSGMFINFILSAMAADYYPRLSGVSDQKHLMNRLANEQTEIGILLAIPGLIAIISYAPWLIYLFYTEDFLPAVDLIQWFSLGSLGRVFGWPLGFMILAKGKGGWFFFTQTLYNGIYIASIYFGIKYFGLHGIAIAFIFEILFGLISNIVIVKHINDFNYKKNTIRLIVPATTISLFMIVLSQYTDKSISSIVGTLFTLILLCISLRGLVLRLGFEHVISKLVYRFPAGRLLMKFRNPF